MGVASQKSDCCLVFALWLGIIVSLVAIVLYVLLFDIDPPHLKPRQALENVAATMLYSSHSVNIVVNGILMILHVSGKDVLDEPALVLCWSCWSLIHLLSLVVLIFLSYYSLLGHFTARLALHLGTFLLVLVEAFLLQHLFRHEDDCEDDLFHRKMNLSGEVNKVNPMQGESQVM
eukprot:GFUD01037648.1.p1 GENE.GFUD01037648.1~~GFUD01037648.1.p1  ORF type:complete len:183 (-),score=44.81 GFUD01037648.1:186-710(-)